MVAASWTRIGTLGSPARAWVDRQGGLILADLGWSLEWAIGADDRWHVPAEESTVRQSLVEGAPVVQTLLRVPGGEAVLRLGAWQSSTAGAQVLVEVDNASAAPFALALVIRALDRSPSPGIRRLSLRGRFLWIDGRMALELPAPPGRAALLAGFAGDALNAVTEGRAGTDTDVDVEDLEGRATAAVVVPVAHRSQFRAAVPLSEGAGPDRAPAVPGGSADPGREAIPTAAFIAAGWRGPSERGGRLVLPAGSLAEAIAAQRGHLLLAEPSAGSRRCPSVADAQLVSAWCSTGALAEAGSRLATWCDDQDGDGGLGSDPAATGAVLCALDFYGALTGHTVDTRALLEAAAALTRAQEVEVAQDAGEWGAGGCATVWALAGLDATVRLLERSGASRAARTVRRWAQPSRACLNAVLDPVARLLAVDLGILPPALAHVPPALAASPPVGLQLLAARVALRQGAETGEALLAQVLAAASPTWTWPDPGPVPAGTRPGPISAGAPAGEVSDPTPPAGEVLAGAPAGEGHSSSAAVGLWQLGRDLCVRDQPDGPEVGNEAPLVLSICNWFPPAWRGQEVEVHRLATRVGHLSYALRWHGRRPALLWELLDAPPAAKVVWRAPGLDPTWSGSGWRGEALLAEVEPVPGDPEALG